MSSPELLAGIELGGTKAVAVIGRGREILVSARVPTTTPAETLGRLAAQLATWRETHPFSAIGVASFGPIALDSAAPDYGRMLATPKPGWAGADVLGAFRGFGVRLALHTDVTAAALAEGQWGGAQDVADHIYMTIGTGIGFGIVSGGRAVTGALHPEAGHIRVRRPAHDAFPGICPFHGDCLEGLASGPAIAARAGRPATELAADDPIWPLVADPLAEALLTLILTTAPRRILAGGGVGLGAPHLLPLIWDAILDKNRGYFAPITPTATPPSFATSESPQNAESLLLAAAALGADAGPLGALALAALAARKPSNNNA